MDISTSIWSVQHPNAGQKICHLGIAYTKFISRSYTDCAIQCIANESCSAFQHIENDLSCLIGTKDAVKVASVTVGSNSGSKPVTVNVLDPINSFGMLFNVDDFI